MANQITIALIGGLVGALGTFAVRAYFRREDTISQRRRLRSAFKSELEAAGEFGLTEDMPDDPENSIPSTSFLPTDVYQENAHLLGELTDNEVEKLTSYYSYAFMINQSTHGALLQAISTSVLQLAPGTVSLNMRGHYERLETAEEKRQSAIEAIEEEMDC